MDHGEGFVGCVDSARTKVFHSEVFLIENSEGIEPLLFLETH